MKLRKTENGRDRNTRTSHRVRNFLAACGTLAMLALPFTPRLAHAEEREETFQSQEDTTEVANKVIEVKQGLPSVEDLKGRLEAVKLKAKKQKHKIDTDELNGLFGAADKYLSFASRSEKSLFGEDGLTDSGSATDVSPEDLQDLLKAYSKASNKLGEAETLLSQFESELSEPVKKEEASPAPVSASSSESEEVSRRTGMRWAGSDLLRSKLAVHLDGGDDVFHLTPAPGGLASLNPAGFLLDKETASVGHIYLDGSVNLDVVGINLPWLSASLGYRYLDLNTVYPLAVENPQNPSEGTNRSVGPNAKEQRFLGGVGALFDFGNTSILVVPKVGYSTFSGTVAVTAPHGINNKAKTSEKESQTFPGFAAEAKVYLLTNRLFIAGLLSNSPYQRVCADVYSQLPSFGEDMEVDVHFRLGRLLADSPEFRNGDEVMYTTRDLGYLRTEAGLSVPLVSFLNGNLVLSVRLAGDLSSVDEESLAFGGNGGIAVELAKRVVLAGRYDPLNGMFSLDLSSLIDQDGYFLGSDSSMGIPNDINNISGRGRAAFGALKSK